jgi:hypothetical protein
LFTTKGNLVFMNNLYHRVAVTSVGIALGFALGANKEARAATFTFTSTRSYFVVDYNLDGVVDDGHDAPGERYAGLRLSENYTEVVGEYRSSYQFNIANLSLDSNTRIESAYFQTRVNGAQYFRRNSNLNVYGYTEGSRPFDNGEYLGSYDIRSIADSRRHIATYNVLQFIVNQEIENNDSFWLGVRPNEANEAYVTLPYETTLTITTVPEPTTIFGSAIGLCLGGWLKRKNSSRQNKTKSQG